MSKVDGDNILYHYIQKYLLNELELANEIIEKMILNLSIWLPIELYKELPILLPFVIRDPSCRKKHNKKTEEWGSANSSGFLRDDNSLIKAIPRSFEINTTQIKEYNKKKMGTGFTACHIWRIIGNEDSTFLSNTHQSYNSFVPNLVWLPRQIAKLTDRDGSVAQRYLQALSWNIYQDQKMPKEILNLWKILPCPSEYQDLNIKPKQLNFFKPKETWIQKRKKTLKKEIDTILALDSPTKKSLSKVKSRRYLPTLLEIPQNERKNLNEYLQNYYRLI